MLLKVKIGVIRKQLKAIEMQEAEFKIGDRVIVTGDQDYAATILRYGMVHLS